MQADEAIVLAGGLGTRLRAVVNDVPKPLAPVAGRPFLAWVLDNIAAHGIRRCILATGYLSDLVRQGIGTRWKDMRVDYSVEDTPLGTGGAISVAARQLHGDSVHVLNGDTYLAYSLAGLERATIEQDVGIGLALATVGDVFRYGAVAVSEGRVSGIQEKGGIGQGLINAGSYYLTQAALNSLPSDVPYSFETEVLLPAAREGKLAAYMITSDFIDIGVPEDYLRAQAMFEHRT